MSQNPQGSNPEDSDPEYNQLNEQLAELSAQDGQDTSGQPMMLPRIPCRRLSSGLRASGPLRLPWCLVLSAWFAWGLYIGMSKAKEAERLGVSATAGRRMSKIGAFIAFLIFFCTCVFTLMGIIGSQRVASYSPY